MQYKILTFVLLFAFSHSTFAGGEGCASATNPIRYFVLAKNPSTEPMAQLPFELLGTKVNLWIDLKNWKELGYILEGPANKLEEIKKIPGVLRVATEEEFNKDPKGFLSGQPSVPSQPVTRESLEGQIKKILPQATRISAPVKDNVADRIIVILASGSDKKAAEALLWEKLKGVVEVGSISIGNEDDQAPTPIYFTK